MNIKESLQEHLDYHMAAGNQHDLVVMILSNIRKQRGMRRFFQ